MKVLLVRSRPRKVQNTRLPRSLSEEVGYVMPLGLASIASYLRMKGIPVDVLDAQAEELSLAEVEQRIIASQADIVGVTCMTPTVHDDFAVSSIARKLGVKVVMGGPQMNSMPKETMQCGHIDFGICGEGEYPMFKLTEALSGRCSIDDVPGLVYKKENGDIVVKPAYIHDDLDELPIPARDLFPHRRYFSLISRGRLATVCPVRGCFYQCGFCFKQPSDKKIRFRSPKLVVDEIEELICCYGVEEINFVSDTLTSNQEYIKNLCHEIITRGIQVSWIAPTRVDCVTPDLLKLMKTAGCRSVRFGIESGSPKILKLMNKNINLDKAIQVFRWAKEAGLETFAYFIIGYLYETSETVKETTRFVKKLKPDLLMYNIATPLPGTRLFTQSVEAGLVDADYWKKFLKDADYPRIPYLFNDTERAIRKAYHEFFFSPGFLYKSLCEIRLNTIGNYVRAFWGIVGLNKK